MIPVKPEAIELFHRGIQALAQIERNGILVDEIYLDKQIKKTNFRIKRMEEEFRKSDIYKKWKKRFGDKTKLGAKQQLEKVIFEDMGGKYKRTGRETKAGGHKADESAFEFVDDPNVAAYFHIEKLKKAEGTYLQGIKRELVDGYMHPHEELHTTITYRPSANRPNIFNFPIRNEEMGRIIRSSVIAPKGYRVGELDYSGIEVCVSACYHKDPMMVKYIKDPTTDMHRDMAAECYKLEQSDVTKMVRYCAKNRFVFPQFYGSYFVDCSQSLWEACDLLSLETGAGVPLKQHLKEQGITKLGDVEGLKGFSTDGRIKTQKGTFVEHIRLVEEDFWKRRFKVYAQWKRDFWQEYVRRGWFRFKTGFVSRGLFNRKQVCNSPIQGSAFHLLLWSLIQLQDWMNENRLKSKLVWQIYDSMGIYFHHKEIDYVVEKANQIMTKDVLDYWKWVNVPLSIEAEIAPKGGSWYHKQKYEIK